VQDSECERRSPPLQHFQQGTWKAFWNWDTIHSTQYRLAARCMLSMIPSPTTRLENDSTHSFSSCLSSHNFHSSSNHPHTPSSLPQQYNKQLWLLYSAKSTDEFNDFMSYLSGKPLPLPRTEAPPTVAPARAAPARQSSTIVTRQNSTAVVAKPVTTQHASSTNKKSSTSSSSTLDEISLAHLHFNPKLRNSIRA
jgi:hypothetical protein